LRYLATVTVPKAAVDEHREIESRKGQVRPTWQGAAVNLVSETTPVNLTANG
jgi:hypothetical protein